MTTAKTPIPIFKAGLFGIGLEAYWGQFDGLEKRLQGYINQVAHKLESSGAEIVNLGLVDNIDKAFEAGSRFRREDVDVIFLYVTTYALSATVLPVVKRAKVPVIVLNLAPEAGIDYASFNQLNDRTTMTGEWLAYCSACALPEIANVFKRSGIPFHQVTGALNDPAVWQDVDDWLSAAKVAHAMYYNKLGLMGNYYGGMLDIYSNLTLQCAVFGGHMEIIEVDELSAMRLEVSDEEIDEKLSAFYESFEIDVDCLADELKRAARTSVAMDRVVKKYGLGSMAYYHKRQWQLRKTMDTMSSIILASSLLTSNGVPVAGEYEVKNAQAMKIMDSFGAGGSFTEYYAMDYADDVVLMGHDGPCHPAIAEGRIKVKPLQVYHGKVGSGLSVEMSVRHGDVTLLSVVETVDGKIVFLVAEAASVPGPILQIGNTNSRYRSPNRRKEFCGTMECTWPGTSLRGRGGAYCIKDC